MNKKRIKELKKQIEKLDKKQDELINKYKSVKLFVKYMQDKYLLKTKIERIQAEEYEDAE